MFHYNNTKKKYRHEKLLVQPLKWWSSRTQKPASLPPHTQIQCEVNIDSREHDFSWVFDSNSLMQFCVPEVLIECPVEQYFGVYLLLLFICYLLFILSLSFVILNKLIDWKLKACPLQNISWTIENRWQREKPIEACIFLLLMVVGYTNRSQYCLCPT